MGPRPLARPQNPIESFQEREADWFQVPPCEVSVHKGWWTAVGWVGAWGHPSPGTAGKQEQAGPRHRL